MTDTQLVTDQILRDGQSARINGEYDTALSLLQQVIATDPNCADAHLELGLVLCYIGDFDECICQLCRAMELSPKHAEVRLQLAKVYTMLGMYSEGAGLFRSVLQLTQPSDRLHEEALKQLSYFTDLSLGESDDIPSCDS